MATQHRYEDCQTLSRTSAISYAKNERADVHEIVELSSPAKLYLTKDKFILSYTTNDGKTVEFGRSFDKPYLHNGKTIKLTDCSFSMSHCGKRYFPKEKHDELLENGWKEDEFLTYDKDSETEITISPEECDIGKPIRLFTVFTDSNYFGTRNLWQRIYFYVGDDEYPFFQMNFSKSIKEQTIYHCKF